MEGEHGQLFHLEWFEFKELRQELEDAITNGCQSKCPGCDVKGIIDSECTHMTWYVCKTVYCYVWAKSADEVDVEGGESCTEKGTDRLFKHNKDWEINDKRCPMYFEYISKVDKRWPKGTKESLDYFHKLLTLSNFKEFIEKVS